MAPQPSIKITKQMTYRGGSGKLFTNRYHFGPDVPANNTDWTNLADAVTAGEKAIYPSYITIVSATGYLAGSDLPVFSKSYSLAGTGSFASSNACPGDCAALIRYSTTARTSKNHAVYLFNYYHGCRWENSVDADTLSTAQQTAMGVYATNWVSGGWVAGKSYIRRGPNGAAAVGELVETYITHRDFTK